MAMTGLPQDDRKNASAEMTPEAIEKIRSGLTQGNQRLAVNQHALFKHAAALPPARRTAVLIAGWGPIVLFPIGPLLYFIDWKLTLLTIFLGIFLAGMGRKYAQAAIRKQCSEDSAFLRYALTVGLVKLL
jgi:hypothetical protein